ncbi:MAG: hypothetical protein AAF211_09565 [Myxococcota bacterium]
MSLVENVASADRAVPARETGFAERTGIDAARLTGCVDLSGLLADAGEGDGLPHQVYLTLRQARIEGHTHYVTSLDPAHTQRVTLLGAHPIRGAEAADAMHGAIDEAMLRCFEALSPELREAVGGAGFVEETRAVVMAAAKRFADNPFWHAGRDGSLTQAQYIHSLANHHHFVRYTMRMIGLAIGACEDLALRAHFAHHLSEEVNHEVWLEQDLAYLDADVEYVKHLMVPDAPIMKFNFVQEALISFRRDPVLFLGVPVAIEGASAFMPMEAIEAIRECIRSWGYERPKRGTRFLARHIVTDGGTDDHDGHWDGVLKMIQEYVRTERQHQQILRVARLDFEALEAAYAGYVAGPAL